MFNVRVTSLEFLNDQNIAVQVLRSAIANYDPNEVGFKESMFRGRDGSHLVEYRTFFLNPETMRLKLDDMWVEDNPAALLGQGLLCPSQRRMPDFGSMSAEVLAAGLHAMRMFFELLLTGPAVFTPGAYKRIKDMNLSLIHI